jgi:hypothetical protein
MRKILFVNLTILVQILSLARSEKDIFSYDDDNTTEEDPL